MQVRMNTKCKVNLNARSLVMFFVASETSKILLDLFEAESALVVTTPTTRPTHVHKIGVSCKA
jgi:hypothetical protein